MKHVALSIATAALLLPLATGASRAADNDGDAWAGFLDYAYVYSSAEPTALAARLERYAVRAGITLRDYIAEEIEEPARRGNQESEQQQRRRAIGYLLHYIASGDDDSLAASVDAADDLGKRIDRVENRYWIHTIRAHEALYDGKAPAFVAEVLDQWLDVIELETPYETYRKLSLNGEASVGFVPALPYLYENIARLIVIRAPQMGVVEGLDPLAGIVRALSDGRVGFDAEAIPSEVSAREYVTAVATRLDGPESDGQSLSFTLAMFEAELAHDRMQSELALQGFSTKAIEEIHTATGGYERALGLARTLQGQVAVYSHALRQLGGLYAAKQRLGGDPVIHVPFSIERAIEIYGLLDEHREAWNTHGYRENGRDAYFQAMSGLWEEIQEASTNAGDYHFARGSDLPGKTGDQQLGEAIARYAGYLSFFDEYVGRSNREGIPDSAYFAAHRASRGIANALLAHGDANPTIPQIELASKHHFDALALHPFDPDLWSDVARNLERQGRAAAYLDSVKQVAVKVTSSPHIEGWLRRNGENQAELQAFRRAVSNDLALMYLGFANRDRVLELEEELDTLEGKRLDTLIEIANLTMEREQLSNQRADALTAAATPDLPAAASELASVSAPPLDQILAEEDASTSVTTGDETERILVLDTGIEKLRAETVTLDDQIRARRTAFPLFSEALEAAPLTRDLATQRHHPVHALLRRLYKHNTRNAQSREGETR